MAASLLFMAWGCSVEPAELGSNEIGGRSGQAGANGEGSEAATGGSLEGGSKTGGSAGSGSGGSSNAGAGFTGDAGGAGDPVTAAGGSRDGPDLAGAGGDGGEPPCGCPYPPVLGGDCCTVEDDCETDGADCETLRASIVELRGWNAPDGWGEGGGGSQDQQEDLYACIYKISDALVERCAFVAPQCREPAEDYATFGDPAEEGYSECTDSETRVELRCGDPGSYYAPNCCQRQRCLADDECSDGRCIFRRVQSMDGHSYPHAEFCELSGDGCSCSFFEVGEPHIGYCIGEQEDTARFDCEVQSKACEELVAWDTYLLNSLLVFSDDVVPTAAVEAYWACEEKISTELELRCEAPADCRSSGCGQGFECTACADPESETHWLCTLRTLVDRCPVLEGTAGAGSDL